MSNEAVTLLLLTWFAITINTIAIVAVESRVRRLSSRIDHERLHPPEGLL